MKKVMLFLSAAVLFCSFGFAQDKSRDKGKFIDYKNEFWEEIHKATKEFQSKPQRKKLRFIVDFEGKNLPKSKDEFQYYWHTEPISQGATGTCWSFSTTSFYESEVFRLSGRKIRLSPMFNAYWEYVEKARYFVQTRGESAFGEGSESNAVKRIWKQYGCVPYEIYSGKLEGQVHFDHSKMFQEMETFLKSLRSSNMWNEELVVSTIKSILNKYMGEPPEKFTFEGKVYTPQEFLKNVLKLNLDDYVDFMSLMEKPYFKQAEFEVPDNWWHDSSYHNVPLDDFINIIKESIKKGYTIAIGGDVSEAGIESHHEVAIVPTFDIPSEYIDENARQFRFSNNTTGDDHGVHLVGYKEDNGKFWFLIKDSGSGAFNGPNKGYYFYNEDFVKLKMLTFTIHKGAVEKYLEQFK